MRKKDFILPGICAMVVAGSLVFNSCSSTQTTASNEELTDSEEVIADADQVQADAGTDSKATADLSDLESTLDPSKVEAPAGASAEPVPGGETPSDTAATNEFALPEATASNDMSTSTDPGSATLETSPSSGFDLAASPDTTPTDTTPQAPAFDSTPTAASGPVNVSTPKIPGHAMRRKGVTLNRFYFVRKGDTPEKISEILYGSSSRAGDLMAWNRRHKHLKAGTVFYYASPTNPNDDQMQSFFQERAVPSEDYSVAKGDWLSTIAKKKLGDSGSWKEIAVVNGLDSPNAISRGQKLAVYPQDLSGFANSSQQMAAAETPAPARGTPTANAPSAPPSVAQAPETIQPPQVEAPPQPPVEAMEPPKPMKKPAKGMDIGKLVEQNLFTIAIGSAVFLLLVALLALKGRKKRGDDLSDDGFSAAPKARRK